MNQVYVALREGDGDAGGGEGIVDDLLRTVYIADALGYQHVLLHVDVHGTVVHFADYHVDAVSRVYNLAPVLVLGTYLLHGLYQYLAYPMDFRTVCHAYGDDALQAAPVPLPPGRRRTSIVNSLFAS